ncbi:MAG: GLPGLI family protein [Bacteroidetes bacterium]|nr:GLPGLI family protein [Bacteroidota bacterium]MBS1929901.1 GLPGLI family protein [Bacteroidota bacterium]
MKVFLTVGIALFAVSLARAQQKEGTVIYERTTQVQIRLAGGNDEMERMIPQSRTDKFELSFANNQSLWKQVPRDNADDDNDAGGNGMQIRMVIAGSDDVLYCNFDTEKKVEKKDLFDKRFIVEDSIQKLQWKLSDETKNILNLICRKAVATRYGKRTMMNMDNGKMERKEMADTSNIVAWFTTDIPVSAGPAEYQGQLPGLILEMDINNGRQTFKALGISDKADIKSIKEPSGKKRYTTEEFNKERNKMMDEMQKNNQGGQRVIRFGN